MNLAHKIRLYSTHEQEVFFKKACGVTRKTFNWGLGEWIKQYRAGFKPSTNKLSVQFNKIRDREFPYMQETHRDAYSRAFTNLNKAFQKFFKKKAHYPKFKKRGERDSFYMANDSFYLKENKIYVPKLGLVKMAETLRFQGRIMSAVVSRTADYWFVSIAVEPTNQFRGCDNQAVVGVDLGLKVFATLSDGRKFQNPRLLQKQLMRLRLLHHRFLIRKRGSKNKDKARIKLSRLHYRISCSRKDFLDKLSTYLTTNFKTIVIEDLNVKGLMRNHRLARYIADAAWAEFRRQLEYKAPIHNSQIVVANRFFPSSKLSSCCGSMNNDLKLDDRIYRCGGCGQSIDRDLNAALNLRNYGFQKIGKAIPESTPVEKKALVVGRVVDDETVFNEAGILNKIADGYA